MGFNKRYIDEDFIFSAFRNDGAEGVWNLFVKPDAVILTDKTARYIDVVLSKDISKEEKLNLINTYMTMRFEGLIGK